MAMLDVYDMIIIEDSFGGIHQECIKSIDNTYSYTENFKIKREDFDVTKIHTGAHGFTVKLIYKKKDHDTYTLIYELKDSYEKFEVGEPVIYQNGHKFELGIVKTICGNDEYFINYHTGDTAARTHARHLHKISNNYVFHIIRLYPGGNERR